MKVLDPGHMYELAELDGYSETCGLLTFVKREGEGYPGNVGHYAGTNLQEVLRALIERVKYLDNQIHDDRNDGVIRRLRECLWLLEDRAAERHGRHLDYAQPLEGFEDLPVCGRCGHVGCDESSCHPH